jgi:FeS assembly SUF system regulator
MEKFRGDMVKISKMVDYSVLVLCQLAVDKAEPWSASRLADKLGLNQPTLAKICRLLAKSGILSASRGAQGGYLLDKQPEAISLYSVMVAVEGEGHLVNCSKQGDTCACFSHCHLQATWGEINAEIKAIFQDKTIASFAPRAVGRPAVMPLHRGELG